MECRTDYYTCLSDHYPIRSVFDKQDHKKRNKWFHTDPTLFKLPPVQEEVSKIWHHLFNQGLHRAKAWSLAINSTQSPLICTKKGAKELINKRKASIQISLAKLEQEAQDDTYVIKLKLTN